MPDANRDQWDLTRYLVSLGLSQKDAEEWIEARREGRPFAAESAGEFGKHLDRIWKRNLPASAARSND